MSAKKWGQILPPSFSTDAKILGQPGTGVSGNSRLPYKFVGISHEFIRHKGIPAHPLSVKGFWAQWLSVKGGGYPPISLRRKSAKKTAIFGQKTPILALFDPFFEENFRQFSVKGGGVPPLSAKGFLAKWFSVKGVGGGTPLTEKIR